MFKLKQKIYETIEEDISDSLGHKIFEVFIVGLIILNVIAIIVESLVGTHTVFLNNFEIFSVVVFSIEYVLRLWTAQLKYPGYSKIKAALKFMFSIQGIIDLLAIVPFYINFGLPKNLDGRIIRVLRLFRLLRILKLTRFLDSFKMITRVVKSKKYELLITFFVAFMFMVIASTVMFELEHDAQPEKFPDIISSFWWSIATLTTVGYGDVYPITAFGKCMSAVISFIGIGLIALPTGIISTGFLEEYRNSTKKEDVNEDICPHCGKIIVKEKV